MSRRRSNAQQNLRNGLSFIAKRDSIIARVKAIHDNFKAKLTSENFEQYRPTFEKLAELQSRFEIIQDDVIDLNSSLQPDQGHDIDGPQATLDSLVSEAQAMFLSHAPKNHKNSGSAGVPSAVPGSSPPAAAPSVRLPRLELPHFNGNIATWRTFFNVFRVSIHENSSLTSIEKFQYLLSCLEDEAVNLVKGLDVTDSNYATAYDLLVKRYNSERRFIFFHFNNLYDLQEVKHSNSVPSFLSKLRENTQALAALGQPLSLYDPFLAAVVFRKMSPHFRRRFEDYRGTATDFPKISEVINYLEKECVSAIDPTLTTSDRKSSRSFVTSASPNHQKTPNKGKNQPKTGKPTDVKPAQTQFSRNCPLCKMLHSLIACPEYQAKSVPERLELVKRLKRCLNCLGLHSTAACMSKGTCKVPNCGKRHNTTLHQDETEIASPAASAPSTPPHKTFVGTSSVLHSEIMLATARVRVTSKNGSSKVVRALLDCASQSTILTTRVAKELNLFIDRSDNDVSGLSQYHVPIKGCGHISLSTCDRQRIARDHPVTILDEISGPIPASLIHPDVRSRVRNWQLADKTFDTPAPIDLLLGADLFSKVVTGKPFSLGPSMPDALETKMGFALLGSAPSAANSRTVLLASSLTFSSPELYSFVRRFWEMEEPKPQRPLVQEVNPAETSFVSTTQRNSSGRFIVRLPFSDSPSKLGDSSAQAKRRFDALERKFRAQPEFKAQYVKFMQDYQDAGFMVPAPSDVLDQHHYFLPHHGVIKESSSTTKLRCVFDGSAKTSTGVSLNDILHVGPKLVNDIRSVLLNFRQHTITLSCDIKQMYNQTLLHEDDQRFHLVYWRPAEDQTLQVFMLTTVTFGISSSAFLAIRSLQQLAIEHQDDFPRAAKVILKDLYVDDCISGDGSVEGALSLQNELINLLSKGGYSLRKWTSNSSALLQDIPFDNQEVPITWKDDQTSSFSILGLQWLPSEDQFAYYIQNLDRPISKRGVLSTLSTIFDPCGWVAPTVFLAKSFMQQLWLLKIDWDTPLPANLAEKWANYLKEIPDLRLLRLPRLFCHRHSKVQVHGFADASDLGYGCVTYLRSESPDGTISTTLLMAKSKVAPLQRVSIPRLELCAAALLADLLSYIVPLLRQNYSIQEIYAWSDSTVTLHWIQTPSYKLKTFVSNRVAFIQETLPETQWNHVKGSENPSDCLSRGMTASQLAAHGLWWHGPSWLSLPQSEWPSTRPSPPPEQLPELRQTHTALAVQAASPSHYDVFSQFSSFSKLQRIFAYVYRFKHNASNPAQRRSGPLIPAEFQAAERAIIRKIQRESFQDDLKILESNSTTAKKFSARLKRLNPFLDDHGLIRVGGRLSHSPLSADRKHPWILPKNHALTRSLITYFHLTHLHAGAQLLQSILFKRYWILSGRSAIRSVIFSCIRCFRVKPTNQNPLMGDLPAARVTSSRPFVSTGMDYMGPMKAKVHTLRFAREVQVYLCVFVCMSTKAVHLELAQDLTSESFLAALTRFSSRRGTPADLFSDNGTNFHGACNELKKIHKALLSDLKDSPQLTKFVQDTQMRFHFNPPAAPHQGGLFEAAVKSAKSHLKRVLHGQSLTLEELNTLIIRIEAMLNSRPLTPMSSDPTDLAPLTPAHFLIGGPLTTPVERDHREQSLNSLKRWHRVQAMAQAIWKRWNVEYLHTLQSRAKWTSQSKNLEVGELVLIHDPQTPPFKWNLGRITKVHPGKDGQVRVASVRTSTNELQRPVVKLYPLPISD